MPSKSSSQPSYNLSELLAVDYDLVMTLWNSAPGVRASEPRAEFARILLRNPGLSTVARVGNELAGAVLCCHDGRRGYLYHLAVAEKFRRQGIARALVDRSLSGLQKVGISRCTIFLVADNAQGKTFWQELGWFERTDLIAFAKDL
ncbi:Acetyltransferase YpeA [Anatilimnocola aggregata]|uniref:Acetyltransferase YpeA n=1 Tax=Anatilimnocola aggregata TaxID=2528021 RepID=A0A517Y9W7_9BACT|nr:GNAT family N-acetyltransferase [Anatilimnocola aggregata]QDU27026.1 Acetyltransferase YpeA [Anatilimnocola aggregata]